MVRKGNVKKLKGTAIKKLGGPAGFGTAGPAQHIRISLRKSVRTPQDHLTPAEEETEKKLEETAIQKLSRQDLQDFVGNGYKKTEEADLGRIPVFLDFLLYTRGIGYRVYPTGGRPPSSARGG